MLNQQTRFANMVLMSITLSAKRTLYSGCLILLSITQLCCVSTFAAGRGKAQGAKSEWVIEQRHYSVGDIQIRFTNDALRIDRKNFGCTLVAKAPDWDVCVFRHDDKVICKRPLQAYLREKGPLLRKRPLERLPIVGDAYICSLKTTVYRSNGHDDWLAEFPGIPQPVFDVIMVTSFEKAGPAQGIILKTLKHPSMLQRKNFVLTLETENPSGMKLETSKIFKVPYKAGDFAVPEKYRATDLRSANTSVAARQEVDSIMEQMGVGDKLGTSPRK